MPPGPAPARAAGCRPAGSRCRPLMSSPARRIQAPASGAWLTCTTSPSAVFSATHISCITTASAPGGISAPVKMRAAVPGCKRLADMAGRDALRHRQRAPRRWRSRQRAPRSHPSGYCPSDGTSSCERWSAASTRPLASSVDTVSVAVTGRAAPSRKSSASRTVSIVGLAVIAPAYSPVWTLMYCLTWAASAGITTKRCGSDFDVLEAGRPLGVVARAPPGWFH